MRLVRLQELKRKLMKEKDFSKTWTFYMDEFADHPEFLEVGETCGNRFSGDGDSGHLRKNVF